MIFIAILVLIIMYILKKNKKKRVTFADNDTIYLIS
uniref:Uncharacterized protein n=1 Tax=viral metagenome TaxID=1070528 RepID=A0A6C0F901_9ZZZZ